MRIWTYFSLAVLGLGVTSTLPAQALDLSNPLPKVAAEELLPGAVSHFYADFNEGLRGNCAQLLRRVFHNLTGTSGPALVLEGTLKCADVTLQVC